MGDHDGLETVITIGWNTHQASNYRKPTLAASVAGRLNYNS